MLIASQSLICFTFCFLSIYTAAAIDGDSPSSVSSLLPSDAVSLLSFKAKADLDNKLLYTLNERFDYCQWQGVKCAQGRVVRFAIQGFGLRGFFPANTLTRLDQLRVLILENNLLSGPIPDLSGLVNLKTLFLNRNSFSGLFPPSILVLRRLRVIDLSFNNLTGSIPVELNGLDRLSSLQLQSNRLNGTIPAFNQSSLLSFNVSGNNLSGPIPVTPTLSHFDTTSFLRNPNLCGEIINKGCSSQYPFFDSPNVASQPEPLGQSAHSQGGEVVLPPPSSKQRKKINVVLGSSIGITVLITSVLCVFAVVRKKQSNHGRNSKDRSSSITSSDYANEPAASSIESRIDDKKKSVAIEMKIPEEKMVHKSGNLVFCAREPPVYTLEQLMRASAELLGRGTIGITYKALLDNRLTLTVKRLDANKTAITGVEAFERHLEAVGGLRHPNLVPVRAYFQAKGERLVIFDYQPNGSLYNLIHGSRSNRPKPLHWTSCLKIAEDVAQGLAYIHQASKLVHGNLKSSNILLGADFEACLTDYCISILADSSSNDDPDSACYKAPETRKSGRVTPKSDVYALGILLLELLTGKHPSQHPFLVPTDVPDWVQAMREGYDAEDDRLGMLTDVASICSLTSPEQRPAMWQVLKMIQEIKESVMTDDNLIGGGKSI